MKFTKTKTEHHILDEFHDLLKKIETIPHIQRIIPWRISRQQKWSSTLHFKIKYQTVSGIKCIMSKWATAQELFIICNKQNIENVLQILKIYEI